MSPLKFFEVQEELGGLIIELQVFKVIFEGIEVQEVMLYHES